MQTFEKVLESSLKVRFHDCDPFNHLNNSRYIDYCLAARTDQLKDHYDFDIYQLAQTRRIGWVSALTQIAYLSPAWLAEEVIIQTQLIAFSSKSLVFEALMWNDNKTVVKSLMWAKLVHVDLATQKSCAHAEDLLKLFEQIVNPLADDNGFEQRVNNLKQSSRG